MQNTINTLTKAFSVEYVVQLCMFFVRRTIISLSWTVCFCIDFYGNVCHRITDFSISSISKSVQKSGIYVVVYFLSLFYLSLFQLL